MQQEKKNTEMAFRFSATSQEVRSLLVENQPWFVAKDVCDILELSDTNMALTKLDDDEKLTQKIFGSGQNRKMWLVNESGLYALILRSNKPEAKSFRKWITNEVLPSIRKHGYYKSIAANNPDNYIDARDVVYYTKPINGFYVRCIDIDGKVYISVNDINKALNSSTSSNQVVKKLNAKQRLCEKIWLFGNTHPAWFTNQQGLALILASSKKLVGYQQLKLSI